MTKAVLIYNPVAGRRKGLRPQQMRAAQDELERAAISVITRVTTQAGDAAIFAREGINAGAELIIVCGGDGTINEVVGAMAHSPVPMAVLPGCTANVLIRELGLPLDIVAAARMIGASVPRRVALGRAGDRHFLLMAGVGFDAHVVRNVKCHWKKIFGMTSYVMESLRHLFFEPLPAFIINAEGRRHQVTFACISRSQHYGPIRMIPEADLFSDQFYVYCFHSQNRFRYFLYAMAVLAANPSQLHDFSRFPARKIYCERIPSQEEDVFLQVDGELAGKLPSTIEIVPDALTLMVPAETLTGAEQPVKYVVPIAEVLRGPEETACPESPSGG